MAKKLVTLDFETFWDSKDKYTLTKMGAINYIRDAVSNRCVSLSESTATLLSW